MTQVARPAHWQLFFHNPYSALSRQPQRHRLPAVIVRDSIGRRGKLNNLLREVGKEESQTLTGL